MINVYDYISEQGSQMPDKWQSFMLAYAEALLWSSVVLSDSDVDDMENAEEFTNCCSLSFCSRVMVDCLDHLTEASPLIDSACKLFGEPVALLQGYSYSQAGHDFALTRNHHGAGYWDRGLGHIGEELTKLAQDAGSVELYMGDDGLLYDM